jgi:hypothetical protein
MRKVPSISGYDWKHPAQDTNRRQEKKRKTNKQKHNVFN